MILFIMVLTAICLAYANGANDNFKGVATLFGSGTTDYKRALLWATGATLLGSVAALLLAGNLIKSFGGKGLIDDVIATQPSFAAAVALGAGVTVLIATWRGMPISTTHSLIGALLGTGLAAGSTLDLSNLGQKFLIPLLISPILALVITSLVYPVLRWFRLRAGISSEYCLCIGKEEIDVLPESYGSCQLTAIGRAKELAITMGEPVACQSRYSGHVFGLDVGQILDRSHFFSSGVVSFARGLNDTPKIAALLLLAPAFGVSSSLILVGTAIALGGFLNAFRVAETMSKKITTMNHGQGLTANLVTGIIVIGASQLGLPVSTTHVSCGSLFGLGTVTGGAKKETIVTILLAWIATLPLAAIVAGGSYLLIKLLAGQ